MGFGLGLFLGLFKGVVITSLFYIAKIDELESQVAQLEYTNRKEG